jgi:hypothetical protein
MAQLLETTFADEERKGGSPWYRVGVDVGVVEEDSKFGWDNVLFLIFRFGLFGFIICFPCFRGCRVWYMAGGRILFRRWGGTVDPETGERRGGWIVGLRYVPADMERWLVLTGYYSRANGNMMPGSRDSEARKLTADEVYELPEISAPAVEDIADTEDNKNGDIETGDELAETYHGYSNDNNNNSSEPSAPSSQLEVELAPVPTTTTTAAAEGTPETAAEEDPPPTSESAISETAPEKIFTTTMSTSCSICIDDFCEGETIRLLPRCGHAFHTDCILPWLTERKGCCPCCNTPVLCPPADDNEAKEGESTTTANNENAEENENENNSNTTDNNGPTSAESERDTSNRDTSNRDTSNRDTGSVRGFLGSSVLFR